jgi:hypothetical protein
VPSIRFRLDTPSLALANQQAKAAYGPDARIISTEEVRVGGIGGFFARRYLDVVVEVPSPATAPIATQVASEPTVFPTSRPNPAPAIGLAALLEEAEEREARMSDPLRPPVSTETPAFASVLDDLRSYVATPLPDQPRAAKPAAPSILNDAGDLVVIAGLGDDARVVARSLVAGSIDAELFTGGDLAAVGGPRVDDRRSATSARARGVESGTTSIVAFGLGLGGQTIAARAAALASIGADQVWLAVDASRKTEDTEAWVQAVRKAVPAEAIAVLHGTWTSTPDSLAALGLPEGWSDSLR